MWEGGAMTPSSANVYKLLDVLMDAQREASEIRMRARHLRQRSPMVG